MSKIIPNSFQTPNAYIDEFMAFLTPEENVVLSYTARRIFGFHKNEDYISLSQYAEGIRAGDGSILDYGTGLNKKAVRRALDALIAFGLIIEVEPYVIETSTPACYALQLDPEKIDSSGLHARRSTRVVKDSQRTAKGREVATLNRATQPDPSVSDNTPPVLSDTTPDPVLSDTTPPSLSHTTPPSVSDTTTKARRETQGKQSKSSTSSATQQKRKKITKTYQFRSDGNHGDLCVPLPDVEQLNFEPDEYSREFNGYWLMPEHGDGTKFKQAAEFYGWSVETKYVDITDPKTPALAVENWHPAVRAVKAALGHYPQKPLWPKIVAVLGIDPDVHKVIDCATEYAARGKYIGNVTEWLFDWYKNGIPERNGNGSNSRNQHPQSARPAPKRTLADAAREHAEHFGGLRTPVGDARKDSVR